jgi:hypothetical protein
MGPKTFASANAILAVGSPSVSCLPLVTDCYLDETENFYLRWAHMKWSSDQDNENSSVVALQYLWNSYGSVFDDKSLLYATLCTSYKAFHSEETGSERPEMYYHFKSGFHTSLREAIARNAISETHLLAVFLILEKELPQNESSPIPHFRGFLSILESLIQRARMGDVVYRLSFLYYYLLNRLVYCSWRHGWLVFREYRRLVFDAWTLLETLEVPERVFDDRLAIYLPAKGILLEGPNPWSLYPYLLGRPSQSRVPSTGHSANACLRIPRVVRMCGVCRVSSDPFKDDSPGLSGMCRTPVHGGP